VELASNELTKKATNVTNSFLQSRDKMQ